MNNRVATVQFRDVTVDWKTCLSLLATEGHDVTDDWFTGFALPSAAFLFFVVGQYETIVPSGGCATEKPQCPAALSVHLVRIMSELLVCLHPAACASPPIFTLRESPSALNNVSLPLFLLGWTP